MSQTIEMRIIKNDLHLNLVFPPQNRILSEKLHLVWLLVLLQSYNGSSFGQIRYVCAMLENGNPDTCQ